MVVQNQSQLGEGSAIPTDPHHTPTFIQLSTQPQKTQQPKKPKRKDTQVPQPSDTIENVADEAVQKELADSLVRAATTASSLEAKQDRGGGPWCQETMGETIAQTKFESKSKHSNDSLLARESSDIEESLGEDASKHGRIDAIDADEEITLVSVHDVNVFAVSVVGDIVSTASAATTVSAATTTIATIKTFDDITLAQALEEMKSTKPKKGVVIQELDESTTTISLQLSSKQSQEKGKGILIEPVKPINKKNQIRLDEETALNLQAEFDEEERLAREKAKKEEEANVALIETWDDIHAKIDADRQLAERMQAQEQEEFSIKEKATLFQQLLEKRRKHFAAKRAKEKRNKPPIKAQQRKIMCTYLKNMEGYKLKDLKLKEFDSIQEMFDRAFKRVNTFKDFRTELVEGKEKRAGTELAQEITKKQKVEDDKETTKIKKLMEIIPDEEEVAIDAIPLAVKSPSIVDWKIHKEGRKSYYKIIRVDGKSQMYMIFGHMLKSFEKEDLETLYKLVKAKYELTRPVEDLDLLLWGDLKTIGINSNTEDQPNVEAASKHDCFKKPERPPTPDPDWTTGKTIDFRPPQTWISNMSKKVKPLLTFGELMNTPIDFSAYIINHMKIDNLTQQHLVGPTSNLLKGTCKSRVELVEECYKGVTYRLDWTNPEGHQYPFDLSKSLPLIEVQGRQVVHADYFINNYLEYLKGGSLSRKYTTFTTKTKAAKYDNIEGIKDYDYGYLEEIVVRREDNSLHKFKECDFSNLNLRDIKDMMLLLVQKKISNLERDILFDLIVALRIFTRSVVIQKRVEDL
ncbi:hypothetical protein Tco_1302841 [Tanacetum coccineum]